MDPVQATTLASAGGGEISILGLFLQADLVVKFVILLLLAASIWVWAIVFEKVTSLRRANRDASLFEDRFWSGGSLDELYEVEGLRPRHPIAAVFGAGDGVNGNVVPRPPGSTSAAAASASGSTAPWSSP